MGCTELLLSLSALLWARDLGLQGAMLQTLALYLAVGLVTGACLGYAILYPYPNLIDYLRDPLEIIAVRHGGMSFHGGLVGSLLAGILFCRRCRPGAMVWFFRAGYGFFRFVVEFFREPDLQPGLFWGMITMGQALCLAMILGAVILWMVLPKGASDRSRTEIPKDHAPQPRLKP